MNELTAVLVALLLLAGNAFFVGAEFALVSARRTQVEPRAAAGSRFARTTLHAMDRVSLMMAGAQLGITMCSLGLGAIGEPAVADLLEPGFESLGIPEQLVHPVALVVALAIVVSLHMVLGEMVPKNLAIAGPERAATLLGPPLYVIVKVLHPLIRLLNLMANGVLRLLRVQPQEEVASTFTAGEVEGLVSESREEGLLDDEEHHLLTGALSFEDREVAAVVLPLDGFVTVPRGASTADVEEMCVRHGFSRFPVREDDGDLRCYVHVKDLLDVPADRRDAGMPPDRVRPLVSVATDRSLRQVLSAMQSRGAHLARAVEAGGDRLVGLVALEDVVEHLVGEVADAAQDVSPDVNQPAGGAVSR